MLFGANSHNGHSSLSMVEAERLNVERVKPDRLPIQEMVSSRMCDMLVSSVRSLATHKPSPARGINIYEQKKGNLRLFRVPRKKVIKARKRGTGETVGQPSMREKPGV